MAIFTLNVKIITLKSWSFIKYSICVNLKLNCKLYINQ